jgi:hypothetical protein
VSNPHTHAKNNLQLRKHIKAPQIFPSRPYNRNKVQPNDALQTQRQRSRVERGHEKLQRLVVAILYRKRSSNRGVSGTADKFREHDGHSPINLFIDMFLIHPRVKGETRYGQ